MSKGLPYETIAEDTHARILAETKAKLGARREFLESLVAVADTNMQALDRQRLDHFLAKISAEAELRDLTAAEAKLHERELP